MRNRCLERRGQLDQDSVLVGEINCIFRAIHEVVEFQEHADPFIRRGKGDFDFGDDSVCAVGMRHARQLVAPELQHPGLLLHGHNPQPDDVADVPQLAPGAGSDPSGTTGNEPADGGGGPCRGEHADFLAGMPAALLVKFLEEASRLDDDAPGVDFLDRGQVAHVHDAPAGKRHCLPVVSCARPPGRYRHVVPVAGGKDLDDLGLGSRIDDEICLNVIKPVLENRGIPEKVPTLCLHGNGIVVNVQVPQLVLHRLDPSHHVSSIRSSNSL